MTTTKPRIQVLLPPAIHSRFVDEMGSIGCTASVLGARLIEFGFRYQDEKDGVARTDDPLVLEQVGRGSPRKFHPHITEVSFLVELQSLIDLISSAIDTELEEPNRHRLELLFTLLDVMRKTKEGVESLQGKTTPHFTSRGRQDRPMTANG